MRWSRRWQGAAQYQRPMAEAVVDDAVRRTRDLDVDRIISRRALRQAALGAAAATMRSAMLGVFSAAPAGRAAGVAALYLFPERSPSRSRRAT